MSGPIDPRMAQIAQEDFEAAMCLLGVITTDPQRRLVSVVISESRVTATYIQHNRVIFFTESALPENCGDA